jgi:glyceraldehyde 3-phosphate dehydrogenase
VHGPFKGDVKLSGNNMNVNNQNIQVFAERDPKKLPWSELKVDIVLECTGLFLSKETASMHLEAGATKVIISAPGKDVDNTIVYGVNHETLTAEHKIISNASCTTNCLAPVAKVLNDVVGIEEGLMTTIHAYTGDQPVLDVAHSDLRRARAAGLSMIPTSTGAAKAVGLVLPELKGKLDGFAIRVPTPNVSVVDLTFTPKKPTTVEGIMGYNVDPIVSIDMNHNPHSSMFDATQTRVMPSGKTVKILSWYDNEWGFSNRMLDTASYFGKI